ncbi:MAG TPA: D-alanyl-D-alanine carboxypeptidase family protein [Rhodopila sp.]|uniref:D-alanyl-D-alanine carboxypeptidase family protein n=1 Tax=Rhodopila sp. TaxID=2480087 RepID=UPI002C2CA745|nr:D-alanyl-D-alanine carboxypeptidase family protein [Rhodopila sp.]HVY14797.1 D-alanyl-D-alanine carboxypeptidase family protein [Rhodopila sp.]
MPRIASAQLGAKPSGIVIEAATGKVLEGFNPDERRFPASLTKMMTLYLTFEALRAHRISLNSAVPVSPHAASMEPTKLWLKPGMRVTVKQCILGMVTVSANDAASAMGEFLGRGSETRFAQIMTRRARALGMTHTVFRNASGLPNPAQVTTARDMAILARALIRNFPQYYPYFSVRSFVFRGRTIYGHDPMLDVYAGADGLKTGYTSAAGFNMATSAMRDGVRIIGIVLGSPSVPQRSATMISLLDDGFAQYQPAVQMARAGSPERTPRLIAVADAAEVPVRPAAPPPRAPAARGSVPPRGYSVQVGSFPSYKSALSAVRRTVATVGGVAHVKRFAVHRRPIWQGTVVSLRRGDALRACPLSRRRAGLCFITGPDGRRWRS